MYWDGVVSGWLTHDKLRLAIFLNFNGSVAVEFSRSVETTHVIDRFATIRIKSSTYYSRHTISCCVRACWGFTLGWHRLLSATKIILMRFYYRAREHSITKGSLRMHEVFFITMSLLPFTRFDYVVCKLVAGLILCRISASMYGVFLVIYRTYELGVRRRWSGGRLLATRVMQLLGWGDSLPVPLIA